MPLLICPNCNIGMAQVQRSGVELDMCPQCRGVWLDRGELEKLLQPLRDEVQENRQPERYRDEDHHHESRHAKHHDHDDDDDHYRDRGRFGRRRSSILDIFD